MQKSNCAAQRGRVTRADRIAHQLIDILEVHRPAAGGRGDGTADPAGPVRRAPAADPLERPPARWPSATSSRPRSIPTRSAEVQPRWRRRAARPVRTRVHVLRAVRRSRWATSPSTTTPIRHLGVVADQIARGYGSALLEFASLEIFAERRSRGGALGAGRERGGPRLLPVARLDRDRRPAQGRVPALPGGDPRWSAQPVAPRGAADEHGHAPAGQLGQQCVGTRRPGSAAHPGRAGSAVPALASTRAPAGAAHRRRDRAGRRRSSRTGCSATRSSLICLLVALVRARRRVALALVADPGADWPAHRGHVVSSSRCSWPTAGRYHRSRSPDDPEHAQRRGRPGRSGEPGGTRPTWWSWSRRRRLRSDALAGRMGWDERFPYAVGDPATNGSNTAVYSRFPLSSGAPCSALHLPASGSVRGRGARDRAGADVRRPSVQPVLRRRPLAPRARQVVRAAVAAHGSGPLIVAGDFNAIDDHGPMQRLRPPRAGERHRRRRRRLAADLSRRPACRR